MWRMGQPADEGAWDYVRFQMEKSGKPILIVKLNDDNEGKDEPMLGFAGWTLSKNAIPPEDDKPWTVFVKPDPNEVTAIVKLIVWAHQSGWVVAHHCTHGRDRTSLITALVGMKLFGWTKKQAWDDMIAHGFRWELPDLDAFWLENVEAKKLPK